MTENRSDKHKDEFDDLVCKEEEGTLTAVLNRSTDDVHDRSGK